MPEWEFIRIGWNWYRNKIQINNKEGCTYIYINFVYERGGHCLSVRRRTDCPRWCWDKWLIKWTKYWIRSWYHTIYKIIPDKLKRNACICSSRGSSGKAFLECGRILTKCLCSSMGWPLPPSRLCHDGAVHHGVHVTKELHFLLIFLFSYPLWLVLTMLDTYPQSWCHVQYYHTGAENKLPMSQCHRLFPRCKDSERG